MILEGVTQQ